MSEVRNRVNGQDTWRAFPREIIEGQLLQMFKEKFSKLAPSCGDRIIASDGDVVCMHRESSPTDCRFSFCPRLELSLDAAAGYLENTEAGRC